MSEPRSHDFTRCSWGHNFESTKNDGQGNLTGFTWSTPTVQAGDTMTWTVAHGTVTARVDKSEPCARVSDMKRVEVTVIERIANSGEEWRLADA